MFIPVGFLYAIIPVLVTGFLGFVTWLVSTSGRHAELIAQISTQLNSQGDRLKRLEGFQDGVQFGRSIEEAKHLREHQ